MGEPDIPGGVLGRAVVAIPGSHRQDPGGAASSTLKKLDGAAFILPSGLMVVTSAIGRGTARLARIGYARSANCPSRSSSIGEQLAPFGTRVNSVSRARQCQFSGAT